ncbi:MAG: hypothetical protein U0031_14485 [Thermomicrobiales bacterium]
MMRNSILRSVRLQTRSLVILATLILLLALATPALALFQSDTEQTQQPLAGVFTVTIAKPDVPRALADGPSLVGLWNMTFNGDGTFSLSRQDVGQIVTGKFEAGEATLTFTEWTGIIGCNIDPDSGSPATYAWRRSDDTLTLTTITDSCPERLTLLTTRPLGGFEACAVEPISLSDPFGTDEAGPISLATPVTEAEVVSGVAAQEGLSEGADAEEAIDSLLRQANGCWATGDPTRFLALHSQQVIQEIAFGGPLEDFARQLRLFMSTPLVFERIGDVNLIDPDHAWAYVEVTLGGDPMPQRIDFVFEDGTWLFDTFFLFGPPTPSGPISVTQ